MTVARLNLRSVSSRQDRREARILADAAVELGICVVTQDANWRSSFQDDTKYPRNADDHGERHDRVEAG